MTIDKDTTPFPNTVQKVNNPSKSTNISDPNKDKNTDVSLQPPKITTVNIHLLNPCNMRCQHCFMHDTSKTSLSHDMWVEIIQLIAQAGFKKINFAGGEPMLYSGLDSLIKVSKENGLTTSMVTNGSKITDSWIEQNAEYLDIIAVSIDSANTETHKITGRAVNNCPITTEQYLDMCNSIKHHSIRLKINTVVTCHNINEDMQSFIKKAKPERWKIMQALPIVGQNDQNIGKFEISSKQFQQYVKRNRVVEQENIVVVAESNDLMVGSYVMIDPRGCLIGNMDGKYVYSQPIQKIGIEAAMAEIKFDVEAFERRGGDYS